MTARQLTNSMTDLLRSQEVDFSVQKNDPCVQVHPGQHNQDGGEGLRHHRGELLQHRQHHPIPFFYLKGPCHEIFQLFLNPLWTLNTKNGLEEYSRFSSIKRKISHNRIKWQCHEIFGIFFHESNLPGPLINRLKWFCWNIQTICLLSNISTVSPGNFGFRCRIFSKFFWKSKIDYDFAEFCQYQFCLCRPLLALKENIKFVKQIYVNYFHI